MSRGFSSVRWSTPPYWGWNQVPGCWSRSLGVLSELSLLLLTMCSTSLQHWHLGPKVEQCWGQRGLRGQLAWAQDCAGVALAWQRLVVRRWCFHFCGPGLNPCWGTEIPQAEQPKQNKKTRKTYNCVLQWSIIKENFLLFPNVFESLELPPTLLLS